MPLALRSIFSFSLLLTSATVLAACSWTSDGGLGARIESDVRSKSSAEGSWKGEPLRIHDAHGQIEIVGVPGKQNISVHAKLVAGATSQADADAAFDDLFANGIRIDNEAGTWRVTCERASEWHGSVDPESTGCTRMRVEVPAGSVDAPLSIEARADYGGVHASGLVVSSLRATAPFGTMADVVPVPGADIELRGDALVSGFCSTILRVPADLAADQIGLSVTDADLAYVDDPEGRFVPGVILEGLSDVVPAPTNAPRTAAFHGQVGEKGRGAARIVLHADQGHASLTTTALPPAQDMNVCQSHEPLEITESI